MKACDREICRPGGFGLTERMLKLSGISEEYPAVVLDVGCGDGATVQYIGETRRAWRAVGIDPACRRMPAEADELFLSAGEVMNGTAERLVFPDHSVDLVLMECSFSRTGDPEAALLEAFRVLKPEGRLLISDMYSRLTEMENDGFENRTETGPLSLGRLETAGKIRERLWNAGFAVLEMEDVSGALAEMAAQWIMDGKSAAFRDALGVDRKVLKRLRCGYYFCAAQPSPLWETLSYVREKSPYYREKWKKLKEIDPGDWEAFHKLPFTTPEDVRGNPEDFLCVPPKEIARIITLKTSGSQGKPKRLFFTEEDLLRTADFYEKGMQYMVKPGGRVTVYMEGPGRFSVGGLLGEGLERIGVEVTVHGLIRDLKKAAGDGEGAQCFVGVPGQMYALAVEAPYLRPETVLLSADYVPESVKSFLEETWHCRVFTHWGMTETGYGGAVQCQAREGCHIRDNDLLLEVIDPESGRPAPEGGFGELVLTTFHRKGMPLIRYRTGDLGRLIYGPCGCGCLKPRLDKVEARLDDGIILDNGRLLSMHVLDEILLAAGEVQDFKALYDEKRACLEIIVSMKEKSERYVKELRERLFSYFGGAVSVDVRCGEVETYIGSGKRKVQKILT